MSKLLFAIPVAEQVVKVYDPASDATLIRVLTGYEVYVGNLGPNTKFSGGSGSFIANIPEFGPSIAAVPVYRDPSPDELELKASRISNG